MAPGAEIAEGAPSGIGYEMVIHTPEEASWPVFRLLDMMAYNLVCLRAFALGHRYPVEGSLTGGETKLNGFVPFPTAANLPPTSSRSFGVSFAMS